MKHSQYLLPALPDLLKSHRLSYKKFLHNGIDEEFHLLSAKTELNEEELFYESLKFHHVDELSPSHIESLDYIYHPEEKIFLMAAEGEDIDAIVESVKQVLNNCILDDIDVDSLPIFADLSYQ